MPDDRLEQLIAGLEHAAVTLRTGELAPERAAALVDECARLAADASAELDRRMRAAEGIGTGPAPGQLALGGA